MESLKQSHLKAVKHILRYIKGTTNFGLMYKKGGDKRLIGFRDSSHGMEIDGRKGITGMIFYLSEFMAATATTSQALWLRSLLKELIGWKEESVRMKQIDVKHISVEEQRAYPLTKALPRLKFLEMRDLLGVIRLEDKARN
ncbi:secreted RxLR effector protein 161-like [Lactuca sativa]|uniref:secreted RxLR effector protein 161-like n=1 Tax=Lactuca sativa TaxID=4236 RepID=UPI001C68C957|nr:secreted RxLR effector protein 161-like [Lactuca sativa]